MGQCLPSPFSRSCCPKLGRYYDPQGVKGLSVSFENCKRVLYKEK